YALSLLPTPPFCRRSTTVIGWLLAITEETSGDTEAGLDGFEENCTRLFSHRLVPLVRNRSRRPTERCRSGPMISLTSTRMNADTITHHKTNSCNIPLGRIGDADGIIESVPVEDNKMRALHTSLLSEILPNNRRAMPSYRLCTSDGPIQPTEGLAEELRTILEDVALHETSLAVFAQFSRTV
ncbi:hypothetical protein EDC04DRAFT_2586330, partial [Pisolithus marmoratus]